MRWAYDLAHMTANISLSGHSSNVSQAKVMPSQSLGPQPASSQPSQWYTPSATCNRSYMLAAMRAGVIALVLLGILVLIVWF